jgi:hypothetical protein
MIQHTQGDDAGSPSGKVQSLKEIKKSRRTVILGNSALTLPVSCDNGIPPLTPPLSDRASGDVDDLYSPETEERYESVDLSSDEEVVEWIESEEQSISIDDPEQVVPLLKPVF